MVGGMEGRGWAARRGAWAGGGPATCTPQPHPPACTARPATEPRRLPQHRRCRRRRRCAPGRSAARAAPLQPPPPPAGRPSLAGPREGQYQTWGGEQRVQGHAQHLSVWGRAPRRPHELRPREAGAAAWPCGTRSPHHATLRESGSVQGRVPKPQPAQGGEGRAEACPIRQQMLASTGQLLKEASLAHSPCTQLSHPGPRSGRPRRGAPPAAPPCACRAPGPGALRRKSGPVWRGGGRGSRQVAWELGASN